MNKDDQGYNGWANYETWNIALWLGNDEGLYRLSLGFTDYSALADDLREIGVTETPDGVAYNDSGLDVERLDEMLVEQREDD